MLHLRSKHFLMLVFNALNAGQTRTPALQTFTDPPFPFEGRFWHVCHGDHLLSRSDPHDRAVVTLSGALQPQTGESSPGQSPLHNHSVRHSSYIMTHSHTRGKERHPLAEGVFMYTDEINKPTSRKGDSSNMLMNSGK